MVVIDRGLEAACTIAVGVAWAVMSYVRKHVPHGEARFDSKTGKPIDDD